MYPHHVLSEIFMSDNADNARTTVGQRETRWTWLFEFWTKGILKESYFSHHYHNFLVNQEIVLKNHFHCFFKHDIPRMVKEIIACRTRPMPKHFIVLWFMPSLGVRSSCHILRLLPICAHTFWVVGGAEKKRIIIHRHRRINNDVIVIRWSKNRSLLSRSGERGVFYHWH